MEKRLFAYDVPSSRLLNIRIKYFDGTAEELNKITKGDWIDLRAAEDVVLHQNDEALIRLGVAMELPKGYEAHLTPRSSTFKNYGIIQTNSIGIIDGSYCGDNDEWMMPVICLKPRMIINDLPTTIINKGDRIAQFRVIKSQPRINFIKVNSLGNEDRSGFGSTGIN
jgi:dUTP pyrophosphatase